MKRLAALAALTLFTGSDAFARPPVFAVSSQAVEGQGCPAGSFNVVTAPDGSALTVLFDNFSIKGPDANAAIARITCTVEIPLHLPDGYSLGVYKVDYRGFAHLDAKQRAELDINYGVLRHNRSRNFRRGIKGAYDGDFNFTERLGAGLMKRAGCGEDAVLNFAAALTLQAGVGSGQATMALDSVDGAPKGGLVFGLDLKKCGN